MLQKYKTYIFLKDTSIKKHILLKNVWSIYRPIHIIKKF